MILAVLSALTVLCWLTAVLLWAMPNDYRLDRAAFLLWIVGFCFFIAAAVTWMR